MVSPVNNTKIIPQRKENVPNDESGDLGVELVLLSVSRVLVSDGSADGITKIDLSIQVVGPRRSVGI